MPGVEPIAAKNREGRPREQVQGERQSCLDCFYGIVMSSAFTGLIVVFLLLDMSSGGGDEYV